MHPATAAEQTADDRAGTVAMPFVAGNAHVTVLRGIVQLYRERGHEDEWETVGGTLAGPRDKSAPEAKPPRASRSDRAARLPKRRSQLLCMLGVPAAMGAPEMLRYLAPAQAGVQHVRMIRRASAPHSLVLIRFRTQELADAFYAHFHGRPFTSMEPDVCRLAFAARIEVEANGVTRDGATLVGWLPHMAELPTCPVCLERLDESVTGVVSTLCNHDFHCHCLAKCDESRCPVCRHCLGQPAERPTCMECGTTSESLWMCLVCAHVGCGRYEDGHAYRHFLATQHTYALDIETQRVWDYIGDQYVHRLIQNRADGKLVELTWTRHDPSAATGVAGPTAALAAVPAAAAAVPADGDAVKDRLDAMALEYTYLLTGQLESQRRHFQSAAAEAERRAQAQHAELQQRLAAAERDRDAALAHGAALEQERRAQERRAARQRSRLEQLQAELATERELTALLRANLDEWRTRWAAANDAWRAREQTMRAQMDELQAQVHDLMVCLDTRRRVEAAPEAQRDELLHGTVVLSAGSAAGAAPAPTGRRRTHRGGGR